MFASARNRAAAPPAVAPAPEPPKPAKLPATEARPATPVLVPQPAMPGIVCPACGRGMVPRLRRVHSNGQCYADCTLCGGGIAGSRKDGKWLFVRATKGA